MKPASFFRNLLSRPGPSDASTPDEVRTRIASFGTWMYRFNLGEGLYTQIHDEYLDDIHRTRAGMMIPEIDRAFAGRWPEITCLDAACNEGFFGFEIAKRGAKSVIGFDARDINIQKANFVREILHVDNISFRVDDVFDIEPQGYGTFDLTLCLGLLYHLENPVGALRRLRSVTKELCVIDTEVLRPGASVVADRGPSDGVIETQDVLGVFAEPEWQWNPLSSVTGISFVPSSSALLMMLKQAGFGEVTQAEPFDGCNERYRNLDRIILFARV